MNRRQVVKGLTATAALLLTGSAAFAASFADDVVSQLAAQGFYNITVETTWLGRVRIVADRGDGKREIILNPRTGEILRDSWQSAGGGSVKPIIDDIGDDAGGDNSGSDGAGGGDDHSGSGSGGDDQGGDSSGSGGDGSGHGGTDDSGSDGGGSDGSGSDDSGHGGGQDDGKSGKDG